jgi:hypothetical protein
MTERVGSNTTTTHTNSRAFVAHACGTQSMANAAKRELVAAYDIITCNLKIPLKKIKVRPTLPLPHSPQHSAPARHTQTPIQPNSATCLHISAAHIRRCVARVPLFCHLAKCRGSVVRSIFTTLASLFERLCPSQVQLATLPLSTDKSSLRHKSPRKKAAPCPL